LITNYIGNTYIGLYLNLYVQGIQPLHVVALCNSFIPPWNRRIVHSSVMCVAVCFLCQQLHPGESLSPQLWSMCPVLPCPVRSLFNATQSLLGRSEPGTPSVGLFIRLSLSGLLLFHSLFHSVFILNFPDINYWASLQVGFLDFSFILGPVFMSFWIGSIVFEKHLFHSRISELYRCRCGGHKLLSTGSQSMGEDLTAPVIILIAELSWVSTLFVWALCNHTGEQ